MNLRSRTATGFTLIELMVVLAIAGIIAMVAIPSYQRSVQKNNRAVAKARIAQAAQMLERFYSDNNTYFVIKNTGSCALASSTTASSQDGFMKLMVPGWNCSGSNTVYSGANNETTSSYTVALTSDATTGPNAFTLTATPQAGTSQAGDSCGALTLTNTGVKGYVPPSGSTAQLTDCW